jgi:membrane protein DedA with SNARE-associated domain
VPDWILDLFARYGYGVVFIGVMLENAGLPVPGETMLLAGAALAHFGRLALPWVILAAIAGATLGDNVGFLIGRWGGRALIVQHGRKFGLTARRLATFEGFFDRHGPKTVFIARFVTGLRVFGALLAGASRLPWGIFLFYNAAGAIVWSIVIAAVGYFLGHSWESIERWVGRAGTIALVVVAAAAVWWWLRSRRRGMADAASS